jgi:hypothetical protein
VSATPKRRSLYWAVIQNVLFLTPFRIVMHGPDGDWISWSGGRDSFARALEIHRHYRRMGFL